MRFKAIQNDAHPILKHALYRFEAVLGRNFSDKSLLGDVFRISESSWLGYVGLGLSFCWFSSFVFSFLFQND
jgi:hypothetical protein